MNEDLKSKKNMNDEKFDYNSVSSKWQRKWEQANLGKAIKDSSKKKFFLIWAYATVSGFQHTGHMRGYSYADAICRYMRMKGYNVLLSAGGHATGNGAIAKAQKIKQKDEKWVEEFKSRNLTNEEIQKISEPQGFIDYFAKTYVEDYKRFGFLGDWDRFVLTTTPDYNKFIEWQFHKLNEKELLIQKPYFATACESCGPVSVDASEMDLSKGGLAEVNEYTVIKLRFEEQNQFIVCATLRPETMYGQTNIWIDPSETYKKIMVKDEIWILSSEAAEKISSQEDNVKIVGDIKANDMLGKACHAPMVDRNIMILPSRFCDSSIGTGIVTSVPSDAPHDWMGLHDLQSSKEECEKHNLDFEKIRSIKPIPIIKMPGYKDLPAVEICEKLGIKSQDDERLEDAKKEIYKAGFSFGVMNDNCGAYKGQKVSQAKDNVKEQLIKEGNASIMQDLSEEVVCRCGGKVIIKKVEGQWFIKYSDEFLTEQSKKHAVNMNILPQNYYDNIKETLDWFKDRPCARQGRWIGTAFPFDKSYVVEAISDSTLYPIYYLVSKYVNEGKINDSNLTLEFFDYVYLGKGDLEEVANKSNISEDLLSEIRSDVEYWYPLDINLGGKEHRRVHFPPFIMNHVAILPEKYWPKGIFVNEWIMQSKDQKLSKSKGGAQPIPDIAKNYGVDAMRLYYANIASPFVDIYFNEEDILVYKQRLERIYYYVKDLCDKSENNISEKTDKILISKLNRKIKQADAFMSAKDFKKVTDIVYMDLFRDLQAYKKLGGSNRETVNEFLHVWIRLMTPFTPHIAEECWELLGQKSLVSQESWPVFNEAKVDLEAELTEEVVQCVLQDIKEIKKLSKIENPKHLTIIVSKPWKYLLYKELRKIFEETKDFKIILAKIMKNNDLRLQGKDVTKLLPLLIKKGLPNHLETQDKEYAALLGQIKNIEKEVGCEVKLEKAQDSEEVKANNASPSKPAIKLV